MGLRDTIVSGVQAAFAAVDDMKETITIREQTAGSYDAATGGVTRTTTNHVVQAVIARITREQLLDETLRATDMVALWEPSEAPGFEPQVGMSVLREADELDIVRVWPVGSATAGPAVLWKMALRRPSTEAA